MYCVSNRDVHLGGGGGEGGGESGCTIQDIQVPFPVLKTGYVDHLLVYIKVLNIYFKI